MLPGISVLNQTMGCYSNVSKENLYIFLNIFWICLCPAVVVQTLKAVFPFLDIYVGYYYHTYYITNVWWPRQLEFGIDTS